ncbi:long-chain-fatty-acid--CoA ligase [Kocuria sp.]|uniref:long-chain-fatty-acid--CoA ligase n=1 Tax=Kocuria sp. TaxID=1871328 RepID=UPI0026E1067A|nr:long-chain fatty acid--CoA ligase [Kocuria sp.]MDO5618701.1 long-chain fatty acid--CoA ligase [Kocuria sp.]
MTNLATLLTNSAQRHPHNTAFRSETQSISYRQLDQLTDAMHRQLQDLGVQPGDRVAVIAPNVAAMPIAYYGILKAGAVVVPLNPLLTGRELEGLFRDAEVSAVLVFQVMAEQVRAVVDGMREEIAVLTLDAAAGTTRDADGHLPAESSTGAGPKMVQRGDDDLAVLLYTSGTTGTPKGAMLTHHNLSSNAWMTTRMFDYRPEDVFLGALPFFHVFGQTVVLNAVIAVGASVSAVAAFQPRSVLKQVKAHGITRFVGVPSMFVAVNSLQRADREQYPALVNAISGGASIPVEVLKEFETLFGVTLYEGYGLSETSPVVCFNHPVNERVPGSIGTACEGAEVRILDDSGREVPRGEIGELAVRGQFVMAGYWKQPEITAKSFTGEFFRTGDVGRQDETDRFFIVDRKKDMILHNGYNVYPREIEEILYEHPAVHEAAVVGQGDITVGQDVVACIVLTDDADADTVVTELRHAAREGLAVYKRPKHYRVMEALPKGPTGKILKREITVE